MARAALAAATACASVICAFTVMGKIFASLVPLRLIVAVSVTLASCVSGCVTTPVVLTTGALLEDQETVVPSAPDVGRITFFVTLAPESPEAYPIASAVFAAATASAGVSVLLLGEFVPQLIIATMHNTRATPHSNLFLI